MNNTGGAVLFLEHNIACLFIRNFGCDAFCPADLPTDRKERMKKRPKGLMIPLFNFNIFAVILKVNKVLNRDNLGFA